MLLEKNENKQKEAVVGPFKKTIKCHWMCIKRFPFRVDERIIVSAWSKWLNKIS